MLYIYNCYGGTHTSSLASAIHLNKLTRERIPTRDEILNTDYFNKLTYKDMGKVIYRGTDDEGNRVFSIGRGTSKTLIPCLCDMISLLQNEYGFNEKVVFSDMSPTVPAVMTMGGFLSRGLGINSLGVPLLVLGAKQAHKEIVKVVDTTRQAARESDQMLIVLENQKKKP